MKSVLWTTYGPPETLKIGELPDPHPKKGQVRIKIHAATVVAGDCEIRSFNVPKFTKIPLRVALGITKPRKPHLGMELAGVVDELGEGVERFQVGDHVYANAGLSFGGYAEYICLNEKRTVYKMPASMTFGEAATITTGGLNALHFIKKAEIKEGQTMLINGAGGSIGSYGLQIARSLGARVSVVDAPDQLRKLQDIGADTYINYLEEDFRLNGEQYDVIFDLVPDHPIENTLPSLKEGGVYLLANPNVRNMWKASRINRKKKYKVVYQFAGEHHEDMELLNQLSDQGKLKPLIDKVFDLDEIVEAHKYVESGKKCGCVVIRVV